MLIGKRGQFESYLLAVITIVIIGIILFFFNHMSKEVYSGFNQYFETSPDYNQSEAHQAMEKFEAIESSNIWDYAFLAIFIGLIIQIVMFSFATRINIAFYWILIIVDLPVLIVGVVLSNVWQELAANTEFVTTIARFPITNLLLGTYYPLAVTFLIFIASIVLFGKRPEQQ